MTEHAAPGSEPTQSRSGRAPLRVVAGTDVPEAASGDSARDAREARTAAARAAHPSTGVGLPAVRRLHAVPAPSADETPDTRGRTRGTDAH